MMRWKYKKCMKIVKAAKMNYVTCTKSWNLCSECTQKNAFSVIYDSFVEAAVEELKKFCTKQKRNSFDVNKK